MAGLGIGNALTARWGMRPRSPLKALAACEAAVGVTGLAIAAALPALGELLAPLFRVLFEQPRLLAATRFGISFLLLLVPASAMGATLPFMVRSLSSPIEGSLAPVLGRLYGANTLGAVGGCLLGEIVLVESLGIRATAWAAATLNLVVAAGALGLNARVGPPGPREPAPAGSAERRGVDRPSLRILAGTMAAGAILLALEVVWFRFLLLFTLGTTYAFALMLAAVLTGLSMGGLIASRWRWAQGVRSPATLAFLAGTATLLSFRAFGGVPFLSSTPADGSSILAQSLALVFPTSVLSGALFPVLGEALRRVGHSPGRATSLLTLANTLGSVAGASLGGFVLLPYLGMEASILGLATAYAGLGLLLVPWKEAPARPRTLPVAAAVLALLLLTARGRMIEDEIVPGIVERFGEDDEVMGFRETPLDTLLYLRTNRYGQPRYDRLVTNSHSMSGTMMKGRRYMKHFVYLPAALHPHPRHALLISFGVGTTARALTEIDDLESIDVVDISADILEMSDRIHSRPLQDPLRDPRVRSHIEDGRFFLQVSPKRYDLITAEPPPLKAARIGMLYSREYFALLRSRLADGGMVSYWLPREQLAMIEYRAIVRAFVDVFPESSLWTGCDDQWALLGIREPILEGTGARIARLWDDEQDALQLSRVGFESPEHLLATFLADREQLEQEMGPSEPLVDDRPGLLSPLRPRDARARYAPLMDDVSAVTDRFAASRHLRRLVSDSWRERAMAALPLRLAMDRAICDEDFRMDTRRFHEVLTRTTLRRTVLLLLGSELFEMPYLLESELVPPGYRYLALGDQALAARDYARATEYYPLAEPRPWLGEPTRYRLVLALVLAGELDRARRILETEDFSDPPPGWQEVLSEALGGR